LLSAWRPGKSVKESAAARQISVGTARVQLKSILSKTSTHRQAELFVLLAQVATIS
jgi:DNA-binding CsgD family transcriptional regulator